MQSLSENRKCYIQRQGIVVVVGAPAFMVSYDDSESFMEKWDINLKVGLAFCANTFALGLFISSVSK